MHLLLFIYPEDRLQSKQQPYKLVRSHYLTRFMYFLHLTVSPCESKFDYFIKLKVNAKFHTFLPSQSQCVNHVNISDKDAQCLIQTFSCGGPVGQYILGNYIPINGQIWRWKICGSAKYTGEVWQIVGLGGCDKSPSTARPLFLETYFSCNFCIYECFDFTHRNSIKLLKIGFVS